MRNAVIWNVRDARGLNQDEKSLLWAIESRGVCETRWRRLADDAGDMSKDRFYRARNSLVAKNLIRVARKYDDVSKYAVNADALAGLVPDSRAANGEGNDSHSANQGSHSANDDSHMTETKKNTKKNRKKNVTEKKNTTAPVVAGAPTATVHAFPLLQGECVSPSMGAVWLSETGDLLFEVDTGSGRYLLCESGVSAPMPSPETRTAAPTKHRTQVEVERREQQRRDALAATFGPEYLTGEW